MKKYYFVILLLLTSCSASRGVINNIYTYNKPTNIYGEPSCNLRDTYIDNINSEFMSTKQQSYYESLSVKDYIIVDIVNHKTGNAYYSDIYNTSTNAKDGYLKINKYMMEYIVNNGNDIKSIQYIYNGRMVNTNEQFRRLVKLSSKDIHNITFQKQDTTVYIYVE